MKLGADTEVAFTFTEDAYGKRGCRMRVRSGSENQTIEPDAAGIARALRVIADFMGVKLGSVSKSTTPKCNHPPLDLASISLADIARAKREKMLQPLREQIERVEAEILHLESLAKVEAAPAALPATAGIDRGAMTVFREAGFALMVRDVAQALGTDKGTAHEAIQALVEAGKVEHIGRGRYRAK